MGSQVPGNLPYADMPWPTLGIDPILDCQGGVNRSFVVGADTARLGMASGRTLRA